MSIKLVTPSNHLIFLLLRLQSFPALGYFQMSQFFASGGQSTGVSASASVLPMNIQDRFPLGWTDWISLLSKGLSRVFSNTTVQKHQFFSPQLYSLSLIRYKMFKYIAPWHLQKISHFKSPLKLYPRDKYKQFLYPKKTKSSMKSETYNKQNFTGLQWDHVRVWISRRQ